MPETYHLTSLSVSPGVTEPDHLTLLDSFTWRYWTVSPDVTGQFHLALLKSSHDVVRVQDSNRAVQYATTNPLNCDCFLK